MSKVSWQWGFTVVSSFAFLFYLGRTNNVLVTLRGLSLGMPDPYYFFGLGLLLLFAGWFMFVAVGQNNSTEIATNVGGVCVHGQKPVATADPLSFYLMPDDVRKELKRKLRDSWKYKDYISPENIDTICRANDWAAGGPEIEDYLNRYKRSVNSFRLLGHYPDGGIRFLGIHGLRWWIGGTAILVVSPEYLINHGDGMVCIAAVETYTTFEQLDELPQEVVAGVYAHFPHYVPGKHTIIWGDQPHPAAVRARVERNDAVGDNELHVRPKYIWTLGLVEKPVDAIQRAAWHKETTDALLEEQSELQSALNEWEARDKADKDKAQESDEVESHD